MVNEINTQELMNDVLNDISLRHGVEDSDFDLLSTNGMLMEGLLEVLDNSRYKIYDAKRERFFVTAIKKDSMYKHSQRFLINPGRAIPAKMDVMLILRLSDVLDNGIIDGDVRRYEIKKDSDLDIGDFYFNLDYDIQINVYEMEEGYSITSMYLTDDTNDIANITNPNIKTIKFKQMGEDYVGLLITIKQFKRNLNEHIYVSPEESRLFKIPYNDQLVDFIVYYQESTDSELEKINKSMFLENTGTGEKTVFYKYLEGKEILIMNKYSLGDFNPERGSKIIVETFTSKGYEGNFDYDGGLEYLVNNTDDSLSIIVQPLSEAIEGEDEATVDSIRTKLIEKNTTRNSLISIDDINRRLEGFNNKFKIIKYRDDVLYRIYNIFSVIKNDDNIIIPTNTLNVTIDLDELENSGDDYMIPEEHTVTLTDSGATLEDIFGERHKYSYPYNLVYNDAENFIKVYESVVDRTYRTEYDFINSKIPISYMVNNVNFKKYKGSTYDISFELRSNTSQPTSELGIDLHEMINTATDTFTPDNSGSGDVTLSISEDIIEDESAPLLDTGTLGVDYTIDYSSNEITFLETGDLTLNGTVDYDLTYSIPEYLNDLDYIKCLLIFKCDNTNIGYKEIDMVNYTEEGDYYDFSTTINFTSILKSDNTADIDLKDIGTHTPITGTVDISDIKFELYIMSEDETSTMESPSIDLGGYVVANVFSFDGELYKDITHLNILQIVNLPVEDDPYDIQLKYMPLVSYSYFDEYSQEVGELIESTLTNMDNLYYDMKDDFECSLLFANTFGKANIYNIGLDPVVIDRTDLNMSFKVRINNNMNLSKDVIRDYIASYFESINFLEHEEFHVSKLIKDIKTQFEEIDLIEFLGINDYTVNKQLITSNIEDVENTSVPEYLNIFRDTVNNELVPDIDITFV